MAGAIYLLLFVYLYAGKCITPTKLAGYFISSGILIQISVCPNLKNFVTINSSNSQKHIES